MSAVSKKKGLTTFCSRQYLKQWDDNIFFSALSKNKGMKIFCQNNGSKLWGCFKETHEMTGICLFEVYGAFNLFDDTFSFMNL